MIRTYQYQWLYFYFWLKINSVFLKQFSPVDFYIYLGEALIKVKKKLRYFRSENDPLSSHTREPTTLSVITGNQWRRAFFFEKIWEVFYETPTKNGKMWAWKTQRQQMAPLVSFVNWPHRTIVNTSPWRKKSKSSTILRFPFKNVL